MVLFASGTEINSSVGMSVERCLYVSGRGSLFFGKNDLFSVEVFSPAIVHKMLIAAQL